MYCNVLQKCVVMFIVMPIVWVSELLCFVTVLTRDRQELKYEPHFTTSHSGSCDRKCVSCDHTVCKLPTRYFSEIYLVRWNSLWARYDSSQGNSWESFKAVLL